ncbi:hypothetical protein RE943_40680 [Prescottella equi]|nr:hypothetical protein RE943_40680 [Prescottella equi]
MSVKCPTGAEGRAVVLQIGPAPGSTGGMASVIEETLKLDSQFVLQRSCASWDPNGRFGSFPQACRAAVQMVVSVRRWDVAHVHLSEYGSFLREGGLLVVARMLRRPAVATLHGANLARHVERFPRITKWVFGVANVVLCLGEEQVRLVGRVSPHTRTRVVANPVGDLAFIRTNERTTRRGERPIYIFAGEVGYRKGFDRLAAAWTAVSDKNPDAQLRVAGPLADGYRFPEQSNVAYLGNLSRSELLDEIAHATATLLPSRAEVLPMVVIESLAQGTPVVYTQVGEWRVFEGAPGITLVEVSGKTEEEIIADLASSMIALADAPADNHTEITAWAQNRFSAEVVADQLNAVYCEVLEIRVDESLDFSSSKEVEIGRGELRSMDLEL